MAIRAESHIMEDTSFIIIERFLLPWVCNDLTRSDYGIDLSVVLAEKGRPVSSDCFQVQLKSVKRAKIYHNKIPYPLFSKSLLTYENIDNPVFIVLCDLSSE